MTKLALDGFQVIPRVLPDSACDALVEQLPAARVGTRALLNLGPFASLAGVLREAPSLADVLEGLVAVQAILFIKTQANNWSLRPHRDTVIPMAGHGAWKSAGQKQGQSYVHAPTSFLTGCVAVRLSLDDVPEGDLDVEPDSQTGDSEIGSVPARRVLVPRGGALVLRPTTVHASAKLVETRMRRVLHYLFAPAVLPLGYAWHHAL